MKTLTFKKNAAEKNEIENIRRLLAENIDDFKYLVLCNLRLEELNEPSSGGLFSDINRFSRIESTTSENLEEWVARMAEQREKAKKNKSKRTFIDAIEKWLMNEAKKDLFAAMDAKYSASSELSSEKVRELGMNLISLADKLDKMKG